MTPPPLQPRSKTLRKSIAYIACGLDLFVVSAAIAG